MSNALAVGDIELQAHEIESGHRFRHRVFDLKAGVEFNESEGAVAAQQELDRPEAGILGSLGKIGGVLVECCPLIFGKTRGRRHLDNLLSPTLQTAIAVAENDGGQLRVGHGGRRPPENEGAAARYDIFSEPEPGLRISPETEEQVSFVHEMSAVLRNEEPEEYYSQPEPE